ncbi:MAG TPA: sulfatase-like hydrolase/transferase [Chitinophagaceae bacterium]
MRSRLAIVTKLFGWMILIYTLLRVAFLLMYFPDEEWTFGKLLTIFYRGFRLDFSALFYINLPFLVYYFFVDVLLKGERKKHVNVFLFNLLNLPFLALSFADLAYYGYNHRRSTTDLADVLIDSGSAFASFAKTHWYLLLVFAVVAVSLVHRSLRLLRNHAPRGSRWIPYFIGSLLVLGAGFGLARGYSERPILPSTPLLYAEARYQPLINNSPFNFLYSLVRRQTVLEKKHYFTEAELDRLFSAKHQYRFDSPFQKRNVVIFVLESFSKSFFKGERHEAYMPFLDSLMQHSTVFNNAYCNALESNKGLPAILASLPDVMDEPIYLSNYNNIPFRGIGHLLAAEGYETSFYMGAGEDHFGFNRLCKMVGIEKYYSKNDFGKHTGTDDGTWGIYDEYFFRYFGEQLSKQRRPFFSVLFNLSSHTPYAIPPSTAARIHVPGQWPFQDSKTYVDYSFRQLFSEIRSQPWFSNTVFVFVADHGYRFEIRPDNNLRELRIPMFIYDPQRSVYQPVDRVVKQLDLVPSILDLLKYPGPFIAFGSSVYRPGASFSLNRLNGVYQYLDSTDFIGYDEGNERLVFHYRYREDSLLQHNLLPATGQAANQRIRLMQALRQRMNNALVDNHFSQ